MRIKAIYQAHESERSENERIGTSAWINVSCCSPFFRLLRFGVFVCLETKWLLFFFRSNVAHLKIHWTITRSNLANCCALFYKLLIVFPFRYMHSFWCANLNIHTSRRSPCLRWEWLCSFYLPATVVFSIVFSSFALAYVLLLLPLFNK